VRPVNDPPQITSVTPGQQTTQYADPIAPIAVAAEDVDSALSSLSATVGGVPGLTITPTGNGTWMITGAPTVGAGAYPVAITVLDQDGGQSTSTATVTVTREEASLTYTGDRLLVTKSTKVTTMTTNLSATVRESDDGAFGGLTDQQVTFSLFKASGTGTTPQATCSAPLVAGGAGTATATCSKSLRVDVWRIQVSLSPSATYVAPMDMAAITIAQPYPASTVGSARAMDGFGQPVDAAISARLANGKPSGDAVAIYRRTANLGSGERAYFFVAVEKSITSFARTCSALPCTSVAEGTGAVAAFDALTGVQVPVSGTYRFRLAVTDQRVVVPASADSFAVKIFSSKGGTILYEAGAPKEVVVTSGDFVITP
jgi:hypothetical protein